MAMDKSDWDALGLLKNVKTIYACYDAVIDSGIGSRKGKVALRVIRDELLRMRKLILKYRKENGV